MTMRMTNDAERELAAAIHATLVRVARDRDLGEVLSALTAVIVDIIKQHPDPRAAVEDTCESLRANFPHG